MTEMMNVTERDLRLREGLHKLHTGQVLAMVAIVLAFIPLINLIAVVLALAGAVYSWLGIWRLKDIHPSYSTGLSLVVGNIVLSLLGGMMGEHMGTFFDLISSALSFGLTYCIIMATNEFLMEVGATATVDRGVKARNIYLATTVLSAVLTLLPKVSGSLAVLGVLAIGALAASVGVAIYYIGYLGEAKECF